MSTQKQKFELFTRLQGMGFTYDESAALRRIEMTLHRWAELECGVEGHNPQITLAIERDEKTQRPFMRQMGPGYGGQWMDRRWPVADREAGALKRLDSIVKARNERSTLADQVAAYHQGDPRGCALYIVRLSDVPNKGTIEQYYTRGLAVAA